MGSTRILCFALNVFYRCGYFMSLKKCSLDPTTRLIFPEDKLEKLELLLRHALEDI